MTLLQAAFSHYGSAAEWSPGLAGGFRSAITHTANDTYGGIGRNGAQKTSEAIFGQLLDVGGTYTWNDHVLHNLQAEAFIKDHCDVKGAQVGYAILSAIAST